MFPGDIDYDTKGDIYEKEDIYPREASQPGGEAVLGSHRKLQENQEYDRRDYSAGTLEEAVFSQALVDIGVKTPGNLAGNPDDGELYCPADTESEDKYQDGVKPKEESGMAAEAEKIEDCMVDFHKKPGYGVVVIVSVADL